MAKTTNEYWIYLEELRRSGVTNMFGATPYLAEEFGLDKNEARKILGDWMMNYNPEDYDQRYKCGIGEYPFFIKLCRLW